MADPPQRTSNIIGPITSTPWCRLTSLLREEKHELNNLKILIGRNKTSDIVIDSKLVSALHCTIYKDVHDTTAYIIDSSTNGTLVNKQKKLIKWEKYPLSNNDVIYIIYKHDKKIKNLGYVFEYLNQSDVTTRKESIKKSSSFSDIEVVQVDPPTVNILRPNPDPYIEPQPSTSQFYSSPQDVLIDLTSSPLVPGVPGGRSGSKRKLDAVEDATVTRSKSKLTKTTTTTTTNTDKSFNQSVIFVSGQDDKLQNPGPSQRRKKPKKPITAKPSANKSQPTDSSDVIPDKPITGQVSTGSNIEQSDSVVIGRCESLATQCTLSPIDGANNVNGAGVRTSRDKSLEADDLADVLTCGICCDLLHDCVSLQPCMHAFCGGCYSDWMNRSRECPQCRGNVDVIAKNHIMNNLVETYLKHHPNRTRTKDDLDDLDKKNKCKQSHMKHPLINRGAGAGDGRGRVVGGRDEHQGGHITISDSEYIISSDSLDGESESEFVGCVAAGPRYAPRRSVSPPASSSGALFKCRQCPSYKSTSAADPPQGTTTPSTSCQVNCSVPAGSAYNVTISYQILPLKGAVSAGPSSAPGLPAGPTSTPSAAGPDFQCPLKSANHILCQCCFQPMPDRRVDRSRCRPVPPQSCEICEKWFCHMYWGCMCASRTTGCLNTFKGKSLISSPTSKPTLSCILSYIDCTFGMRTVDTIINNNHYESSVLCSYLINNNKTADDMFGECIVKLQMGLYTCAINHLSGAGPIRARLPTGQGTPQSVTPDTVVCKSCSIKAYRELAYQYRRDIPTQVLSAAPSRPDCYWGKNCRTQCTKQSHAMKYNHVCEQTRFPPS